MNRTVLALAALLSVLLTGYTVAGHAAQEAALVHALRAPHPAQAAGQPPIAIPDNLLTGHGAMATPDGRVHF